MLTLLTLIVSVGLADSIDPTMILPAGYFASRPDGGRSVAKFAGGVFTVNVIAGVAIALGPGRFLLSLAPHLGSRTTHRLELAAGALLLVAAVVLWLWRPRPRPATHERSPHAAYLVGATIALAELPTALPYFVVTVAVIRAQEGIASTVALLSAYQVLYLTPVLAISVLSRYASRADGAARGKRLRSLLVRYENRLVAAVLFFVGVVLLVLGQSG
jgi:cytochrome c biogenesis protein CcdA